MWEPIQFSSSWLSVASAVSIVAGPQDRHEDRGLAFRATLRVVEEDGVPGVIYEELLAGLVRLPQHHVQLLPPALVEFAEPAVGVAPSCPRALASWPC
jgi:hypothetical protein